MQESHPNQKQPEPVVFKKAIFKQQAAPRSRNIDREQKIAKIQHELHGEGHYIFQNNTKGDLYLPRPTHSGRKVVLFGEQFLGDSYYFSMVKTNELKFIKEAIQQPMEKLITEQPPTVTREGQVEFVVQKPEQNLNEQGKDKQEDVLLTECPLDGVKILK